MQLQLKKHNYYIKEILGFLFLILATYFFMQQQSEIIKSATVLKNAYPFYILLGIAVTGAYIYLYGLMYVYSFKAVNSTIRIKDGITLFLKRNLISVFLPGGGVTSLAFFNGTIEKKGISKTRIGFASYIFAVVALGSLVVVATPVLIYLAATRGTSPNVWAALAGLTVLIVLLWWSSDSFLRKGFIYKKIIAISPQAELLVSEIHNGKFLWKPIFTALLFSVIVEITGILHLLIAIRALGFQVGIEACITGYITATLFFAISPFLRGLGAVEVSLVLVLVSYGLTTIQAISVTVLYRVFEFWLPLVAGLATFLFVKGNILLRVLPVVLLGFLGLVNIISVLTPPIASRVSILKDFLPAALIHFSNLAVLISGILLIICAAFLIKGLHNAWIFAMLLTITSFIGNISKAIDYEEATLALFVIAVLITTRKQYRIKGNPHLQYFGLRTALIIVGVVLVYGITGFYFLDRKEFGIDFSLMASVKNTLLSFAMIDPDAQPLTHFAHRFIHSINLLGFIALCLLVYTFIRPYIFHIETTANEREKALLLLEKFGNSADDYFKQYTDKFFYFGKKTEGFIAYKTASDFAISLGNPVCSSTEDLVKLIAEFEQFCKENGLKPAFYKIDEKYLEYYKDFGKKALPIGQEALVELAGFSLDGKDKKSLRNALNALEKKGITTTILTPPLNGGKLQKLKQVSDEWLQSTKRNEIAFSSGSFNWDEIKNQEVIVLENSDEKIIAFLNIIPDYCPGEGTYDLIRKTTDAPAGVMDALIVALIKHLQIKYRTLNMGMAPMSGIDKPKDVPEWTVKFAYDRLKQFKHYHGLRDFKDKFNPVWVNKYLIYDNHYDLIMLPSALAKVMKT